MKITIEAKSGQVYKLTGEELVQQLREHVIKAGYGVESHIAAVHLSGFLSTYEEVPKPESVAEGECSCGEPHVSKRVMHRRKGEGNCCVV